MKDLEQRYSTVVASEQDAGVISGYAAVFNSPSEDLGGFIEIIAPGAFKRSLDAKKDIRAFADHDMGKILARSKNGTLSLEEDTTGLKTTIKLPNTTLGNDIRALVADGTVSQMSFGFRVLKDSWSKTAEGKALRTITDLDLIEVSVVSIPAYPDTSIALVRKLDFEKQEESAVKQEKEAMLRILDLLENNNQSNK